MRLVPHVRAEFTLWKSMRLKPQVWLHNSQYETIARVDWLCFQVELSAQKARQFR